MTTREDAQRIAQRLENCQDVLTALGDETRQRILCVMLEAERPGLRAAEIAERANISRPTASHHLQILKRAGIACARKDGPRIRYYLDPSQQAIRALSELSLDILAVTAHTHSAGQHEGKRP